MKLYCKNNCKDWEVSFSDGYDRENHGNLTPTWTHCPWCDSGQLVEQDPRIEEKLIDILIEARGSTTPITDAHHKIRDTFNLTFKE